MKKRIYDFLGAMVILSAIAGTALSATPVVCTWCKVSSNPTENDGHCTPGTLGDVCKDNGDGPACSETGSSNNPQDCTSSS